jgi:hypothetical protein
MALNETVELIELTIFTGRVAGGMKKGGSSHWVSLSGYFTPLPNPYNLSYFEPKYGDII